MGIKDGFMRLVRAIVKAGETMDDSKDYLVNFTVKGTSDWDGEHYMRVPIVGEYSDAQAIRALRAMNGLAEDVEITVTEAKQDA